MSSLSIKEKLAIAKTFSELIAELRNIYKESQLKKIEVPCPPICGIGDDTYTKEWYLSITKNDMVLFNKYNNSNHTGNGPLHLESLFISPLRLGDKYYDFAYRFLKIAGPLENTLERYIENEKAELSMIDSMLDDIIAGSTNTGATIEDLSINEESNDIISDTKEISSFDFSGIMIKTITNGKVFVINHTKKTKEKTNKKTR